MKKMNLELKVGIFVLLALASLTWLVIKSGDFYLKPGYTVRFVFDYVSGIDSGSPVKLAGVSVGEVTGIYIIRNEAHQTQAEITARINQNVYIEEDAEVRINSLGMLGEKYVEILPGTAGKSAIPAGGIMPGRNPILMERITESGNRLINKMELTIDHVNQLVADEKFKSSVKDTFGHASVVGENLKQTSEDLKDTIRSAKIVMGRLRDGEGTIGKLLKDDKIAKDLEAFVQDVKAHPWKLLKRN